MHYKRFFGVKKWSCTKSFMILDRAIKVYGFGNGIQDTIFLFHEQFLNLQFFVWNPHRTLLKSFLCQKKDVAQKKFYGLGWVIKVYGLGYGIQGTIEKKIVEGQWQLRYICCTTWSKRRHLRSPLSFCMVLCMVGIKEAIQPYMSYLWFPRNIYGGHPGNVSHEVDIMPRLRPLKIFWLY